MQWLKSEKGSTLMLIMITVAILSMLGTALLAMSFMNFNMKQSDYRIKRTTYYAESGIDQVYARIGWLVEQSITEAITATDAELQVILNDVASMQAGSPLVGPNAVYLTLPEMMLDGDSLEIEAERLYKENFRTAFNAKDFNTVLDGTINPYVYLDTNDTTNGSLVSIVVDLGKMEPFNLPDAATGVYSFALRDVTSTFTLADKTKKTISTDIIVSDTLSSYPMSTLEQRIIVKDNPIWQKALVSNENIDFSDNSAVLVNGDVYGYGLLPANTELAEPYDFGGVRVMGDSNVTINGNVYSRAYVQLAPGTVGNYNSSNLTVNNGLIYANSVVVQKFASGELRVNKGNVYTSDDLELNGTDASRVIIDGSYYGYTDGSGVGATHDASSAIVLNSDMTETTLHITGVALPLDPATSLPFVDHIEYINDINDVPQETNGILIGGTAYIDTYDAAHVPKRYQTGESVSFKGNYLAYSWGYNQGIVDLINGPPNVFTSNPYDFYSSSPDPAARVEANLLRDPSKFELYYSKDGASSVNLRISTGELKDRMAYFIAFKNYIDQYDKTQIDINPDQFFIKGGTTAKVQLANYLYTTGLQLFANDFIYNTSGYDTFTELNLRITKDYLYQLHMMEYRNDASETNIESLGTTAAPVAPSITNVNVIDKYTKLEEAAVNVWSSINKTSFIDDTTPVQEIVHVSDSASPLRLYAGGESIPGTTIAGDEYHDITSSAQGIILRTGDIHIYGDFTFVGPIITNGNIYTHGGTQQYINNSAQVTEYLAELIYNNDILFDQFNVNEYNGFGTAAINLDDLEYSEVITTGSTYDANNNSVFTYNDWIYFEHWSVD